jgi:hypothetical protein
MILNEKILDKMILHLNQFNIFLSFLTKGLRLNVLMQNVFRILCSDKMALDNLVLQH